MILCLQKAMRIMQILSDAKGQAVSLMQISDATGIPKPTCCHLLETLCADGYVVRVSQSEGYILGPSTYCLTRYGRYGEELAALCRPIMRWIEKQSGTTVVLSVIQGNKKYIIDYADDEQGLFRDQWQIKTDAIYRTATGRAILAHMSRDTLWEIWKEYGNPAAGHWDEVTSFESMVTVLQKLREQKIVFSGLDEEQGKHKVVGIGCPLFQLGICVGAIGMAWKPQKPGQVLDAETRQKLVSILQIGVKEIKRRLNYEEEIEKAR